MGSTEAGSGAVDCSVGSIVWVRRRNGSWWPGKILGPDELSASHLMSPRSGTPVKLLGREDASVDWYNLEKSKRVKAFRCGEFDECISRAEASQGMPPKKREKYARREDAILHALELERQLFEKKYGKLGYTSNNEKSDLSDAVRKEVVTSSVYLEKGGANQFDPQSSQVSGKHGLSTEQENIVHHLDIGKVKDGYQVNGDDENCGAVPRVRGLQEFGLMTAPLEQSLPYSNVSSGSVDAFPGNVAPGCGPSSEVTVDANSESLFKRHDKHRPLAHVLQNSAKISHPQAIVDSSVAVLRGEQEDDVCHAKRSRGTYLTNESEHCLNEKSIHSGKMEIPTSKLEQGSPADLYGEGTSDSAEDTETDSSEPETTESDTDEDMSALSDGAASIGLEPKYPERMGLYAEYGSTSSEELDELSLTDDTSDSYHDTPVAASDGVSKWQLKGRRNGRSLMKRCRDGTDRKLSGGSISGTNFTEKGSNVRDKADLIEKSSRARLDGYVSRGFDGVNQDINTWQNLAMNYQPTIKGYWEEPEGFFGHTYAGQRHSDGKFMLIDVDLKVQASYQRPPVPLISLTSKLNGHAIVGHPIQIEILENGSSDTFFASSDDFYPGISDYSTTLPPVWRTARRTANSRVPRSHPSSALDSEESMMNIQVGDYQNRKVPLVKSNAGSFGFKASMVKNSNASSQIDRRLSRKQPKRISLSCNQKIRTLSSIGSQQKESNDLKCGGNNYQVGGLIKPDSVPTAVACIPVKLVFSRLHEELVGRHQ